MKYFLRQARLKKGTYLQIYQSEYFRDKGSRNMSYKAIGYVEELKAQGMGDPIRKAQAEVDRLNAALRDKEEKDKAKKIASISPEKNVGYFVLKAVANGLVNFEKSVRVYSGQRQFQFDVYETMMSLVYARVVSPASKLKTHTETLPCLFEKGSNASYTQILECCEYVGEEYKRIIHYLTNEVKLIHGMDCSKTYFDCTNFYFEIDREDELRRKGPSKEHRTDPIVGMGLLLDGNQLPIDMALFSGNASEKPELRKIIGDLKKEHLIDGRTIQIADKGLDCARNIYEALKCNDGYIFSKSLKSLSTDELGWFYRLDKEKWDEVCEVENEEKSLKYRYYSFVDTFKYEFKRDDGSIAKFTAEEKRIITYNPALRMKKLIEINKMIEKARNLCTFQAKKDEFGDSARYVDFVSSGGEKAKPELNDALIEKDRKLAGYNMIVTSEIDAKPKAIYNAYHNLWRIEQSFRMMKHYLEARPVYLTGISSIRGHFLLCYIGTVLERILEFNILGSRFNHEKIIEFIRNFRVVRLSSKNYINLLTDRDEVGQFLAETITPEVTNANLTPAQISKLFSCKFKRRINDDF